MHFNSIMNSMIDRSIQLQIDYYVQQADKKLFFIWGPRRSGKTTLLKKLAASLGVPVFNFDLLSDRELFAPTKDDLGKIASAHDIILIDEIQNYPESTLALKLLHDEFGVKVVATGSSELRQKSKSFDSLAGRFTEHYCLPLSLEEIQQSANVPAYEAPQLEQTMQKTIQLYGSYPEVYANKALTESERIDLLQNILDTYVLKDVINIYELKNEKLAKDILTKIALQIGSEVSVREIASSLQANATTVASYIEIFIKNYILIPLHPFKTNARRAISENRKLYFYDLGIRNILVKDFRELSLRPDKGGVFENFIIAEVEKKRRITKAQASLYFYREYGGHEVDLVIEDYQKNYTCIEIKSSNTKAGHDVFPVKNSYRLVNSQNCFAELARLFN